MFIKTITIPNKKTGKRYCYYRLCESYRMGDAPRHRTILNLGKLEELPDRKDHKLLADRIEQIVYKRLTLFELTTSEQINKLAEDFAKIIINKKLLDVPQQATVPSASQSLSKPPTDYQAIDINSIRHEQVQEVGAEWLCKQTLEQLGLRDYLIELGWQQRWVNIAMIYMIGRTVFPASDLKTEDWLHSNTALVELYGMEPKKITRHHLYKVSRMLNKEKENIEAWLSTRTGDLFEMQDKIVLYDLTNTYFEGEKSYSTKAKFGKSKEKRNDAKLMALAMVTDSSGFIKYSKIYEGNIKDSQTLQTTLSDLESYANNTKPNNRKVAARKTVVIDAGIATEDNLRLLRQQEYDYVCVSLAKMNEISIDEIEKTGIELKDKKDNKIWVQWVKSPEHDDQILYVKSQKKQLKEQGMEDLFCKRYEEGLLAIKKGIEKKGGTKKSNKIYERLGRLKEKYPSVNRYYKVNIQAKEDVVSAMQWEKTSGGKNRQGVYFVRTSLSGKDEKTIWNIYNTIREIEATFRTLKTDLNMRPVFHQKDIYSESHIYGSILAYTIVNTIRHPLKAKGIRADWRNIVRTMNTQKVITTTLQTKTGKTIYMKKCSEPQASVREIYNALNYKDRPFWQKKSVLPKNGKLTFDTS